MPEIFKIGDVVRLKSGGPLMTITAEEDEKGFVHATWFDASGRRSKPEEGFFDADALVKHQPDDESET